jgi:hypothetical protein
MRTTTISWSRDEFVGEIVVQSPVPLGAVSLTSLVTEFLDVAELLDGPGYGGIYSRPLLGVVLEKRRSRRRDPKMKKAMLVAVLLTSSILGGCGYAGVAVSGDKAVVARNDGFLFGILRKVSVCKVSDAGLTSCQSAESP